MMVGFIALRFGRRVWAFGAAALTLVLPDLSARWHPRPSARGTRQRSALPPPHKSKPTDAAPVSLLWAHESFGQRRDALFGVPPKKA